MARGYRVSFAGGLFHVTARGNNREKIFLDERDFERYKLLLRRYRARHGFKLYAYALMPNHVHLLIETTTAASISKIMHAIHTSYAMYFNARHDHVGHVWQGRFHSSIIDSERYFLEVMRYMDLNPVRAEMAGCPEDYAWTSHRRYGCGAPDDLVESHELYENLAGTRRKRERVYREFVEAGMGGDSQERIFANTAFAGGEDFESRVMELYGRKIWPTYRRLLERLHDLRRSSLVE